MNTRYLIMLAAVAGLTAMITLYGCKKETPDEHPHEHPQGSAVQDQPEQTEQTMCAVMTDMKINKAVFVEYKGKKVYFCCPDCKGKFEAEPEKYAGKLPQFQNQ